jgi:hypothetical protein
MNADEQEIYDFLKGFANTFISATEISKKVGKGRRFTTDRTWAHPLLRRMEMDGLVESNPFGEYCVKGADPAPSQVDFKQALRTPGVSLGDTTIIKIGDVQGAGS